MEELLGNERGGRGNEWVGDVFEVSEDWIWGYMKWERKGEGRLKMDNGC